MPEGKLTPAQYEIMAVVWNAGRDGATVAEIWQEIAEQRQVARTTILNLVTRLEHRGWLARSGATGPARYVAGASRVQTSATMAQEFVDEFFDGSASNLVMSLLGARQLNSAEIERLRGLLNDSSGNERS